MVGDSLAPVWEAAPGAERDERPGVSVVLPVLNEERHLAQAVGSILAQDYPGPLEVVVALGPSSDRTDEVAAGLVAADPRVRTVRNPTGRTPQGLNLAIAASSYPVVARVDGHAQIPADYLRVAVELLERSNADNVGGLMWAEGVTDVEKAIARAMTSKLGVGNARFHVGGEEGPADTVYLGVFRRTALERVGGYDEQFARAQDWEMNYRIRATGGTVWFSPALRVTYRPRPSLGALARQYFHYGRWRREVMRRHPESVNLRYLAPPVALVGFVGGLVAGIAGVRWAFVLPAGYLLLVTAGAAAISAALPWRSRLMLPVVLMTMHGSWGAGFLSALPRRRSPR
jgi:glycosyltransferase involved in cell wall biosynthesis